ncbi:hypothetical protein VCRA2119O147_1030007 [Vibrio crassostreae]|nr:hypothetical protein VCRA2116O27_140013 [Vibrio crassostreae]CAK1768929.1 hypothetical protein VCRA2118O41_150008 [Vibrio crassostreae]CAK1769681.1 hypothetical protein VCRA2116O233_150084 [Vibrio crassostreae]CAK1770610.1 hypothetical protein VCRA2113O222_160040 [Vibrio crassostreae]CAK1771440.1 hypothetical protein VCRA2117O38_150013 [Vibrio crassostreae]
MLTYTPTTSCRLPLRVDVRASGDKDNGGKLPQIQSSLDVSRGGGEDFNASVHLSQ